MSKELKPWSEEELCNVVSENGKHYVYLNGKKLPQQIKTIVEQDANKHCTQGKNNNPDWVCEVTVTMYATIKQNDE